MGTNRREVTPEAMVYASFADAVRLDMGLTQDELAKRAGIPRSTLTKILRGTHILDIRELAALARALGMTTSAFVAAAESAAQ